MLVTNNNIPNVQLHKKLSAPEATFKGSISSQPETLAKATAENHQAYALSFLARKKVRPNNVIPDTYKINGKEIEDVVLRIDKEYQGKGLFDKKTHQIIDWEKVGWDNLSKEPLDWAKATDDEIVAFYHALALAETKDLSWVRRYNETNVPEALATYHVTASTDSKEKFVGQLNELRTIAAGQHPKYDKPAFLDKNLINPKTGKFNLEFCVFDTETTGAQNDPNKGPVDKIIQIGAVKVGSDGEVKSNTAVSQFINPEMPINPGATKVHHITDQMVADKPVIERLLNDFINRYLKDQMLVAYNARFDIPMLNRGIDSYNVQSATDINNKPLSITMDPYIILQRIHPFIGASKKLGNMYKFLFAKNMEGAHDALDDVKGTVDVLKYCCYYLQKHANRPLTVKDVLTFQEGGKVEGLNIQLNTRGYDASKSFRTSYRLDSILVKNYHDGWLITEPAKKSRLPRPAIISNLRPLIGDENADKLFEIANKPNPYKDLDNFKATLKALGLEPFGDKNLEEIINVIVDKSKHFRNNTDVDVWRKNIRTDHLHLGNDLPDIKIIKKVMAERVVQDSKEKGATGRELNEVLKDMAK